MCPMVETPGMFRQNWLKKLKTAEHDKNHALTAQIPGSNRHQDYETFLGSGILIHKPLFASRLHPGWVVDPNYA